VTKVHKRAALIVFLISLAVGAVVFRHQIPDTARLLDLVHQIQGHWFTLPLYFLFVGVTCFLAPAVTVIGVAGLFWGAWPGAAFAWVGTNVWCTIQFVIGRYLGDGAIEKWLKSQPRLAVIREELSEGGVLATVLIRQFPLPFIGVNMSAGMSPIPIRHFIMGNAIGLIPNCIIYTLLADALLSQVDGARSTAMLKALATGAVVISLTLLSRYVVSRSKEMSR
jgi:uncharacterized membrane protein YdjX (TVP38/TMEM64 family)